MHSYTNLYVIICKFVDQYTQICMQSYTNLYVNICNIVRQYTQICTTNCASHSRIAAGVPHSYSHQPTFATREAARTLQLYTRETRLPKLNFILSHKSADKVTHKGALYSAGRALQHGRSDTA